MKKNIKPEEQTIINSIHVLTNFCLRQCVEPGHLSSMREKKTQLCMGSCVQRIVESRFKVKERWLHEMTEVE